MIDISFLTPPNQLNKLSGMEYIDYQGKAFFTALTAFISGIYDPDTQLLDWHPQYRRDLEELIRQYTNLKINLIPVNISNFAITAGFMSPGNVLNSSAIEKYYSSDKSQIGDFFKLFKKNALVGWCDLKTGKVEGDFKEVNFDLYVPMRMFITHSELKKVVRNQSVPSVIAGAILHELGHAFFGLYSIASETVDDIFFARTASEVNDEKDMAKKIKVAIAYKNETGIDVVEKVKKTGELTVVDFRRGLADRNYRRTLSLGVTKVTKEILANAYAIRMGASLAIGGIFGSMVNKERNLIRLNVTRIGIFTVLLSVNALPVLVLGLFVSMIKTAVSMSNRLVDNSHETSYRTLKSALRDIIALIRENKDKGDKATVDELMKDAVMLDWMTEQAKPFLEGTTVQRLLSVVYHGKDAKRIDVENYTADLNYNPLSLYTDFRK